MSGHQKIITLQLISTNTDCFYKIIFAKLLTLNVLSTALYTFKISTIYLYITKPEGRITRKNLVHFRKNLKQRSYRKIQKSVNNSE